MIVSKFGGTSVGDAAAITRLVDIIEGRREERPVVVVSALAGVTNRLLELVKIPPQDHTQRAAAIQWLVERHRAVVEGLGLSDDLVEVVRKDLDRFDRQVRERPDYPAALSTHDEIAALGELWSSRIITAALARRGVPSQWVDIRPLMLTDDRFTRATPDLEALTTRAQAEVRPLLERGVVPVTQGFIGATADGRTTTLGRGGSDFTAALLGAALRVDLVEIWTDVDGILTADPRIAPQAARLSDATYDEAAELATFGAKVLHPATQVPLAALGIPFVILNSFAADHPGTVVHAEAERATPGPSPVRSIAWRKGVILVNVKAPRMVGAFGFLRALFAVFERHEIPVDVIATSEVNVSLTIDESPNLEVICNELRELGEVTVFDRRAIIAVVGIGLRGTGGIAARVFQTIHEAGITIDVISQGASEISITFVIAEQDGPNAVRALHREFLERSPS